MRKAPDFTLADQKGESHSLKDYAGRWLVIYVYPKDDTPGCTVEACSFRDATPEFTKRGVAVLGVSKDSVGSHQKFSDKFSLGFPILSDPEKALITALGAWGEKKFMGKTFEGVLRRTYIINPTGEIVKEYPEVSPKNHTEEVLADLDQLMAA